MVFFRNVQLRWTPLKGDHTLMLALERPGASGDAGVLADRIELQNIKGRFPLPDFTGAYRYSQKWGYARVGWALRESSGTTCWRTSTSSAAARRAGA